MQYPKVTLLGPGGRRRGNIFVWNEPSNSGLFATPIITRPTPVLARRWHGLWLHDNVSRLSR